GVEVAKLISKSKVKVRAMVRNSRKAAFLKEMNFEIVEANLNNRNSIRSAINGVHKIFLLTANNLKQVEQEKNLIDVSNEANVNHIIKYSIHGSDFNSKCKILKRHSTSENYLEKSKINYTIIKPNLFMQNFLMFAKTIQNKCEFYYPLKKAYCGFVDVMDVARVIVKILLEKDYEQFNKQTYTLTGPDLLTCKDIAEIFSTFLHKRVNYVNVSMEEFVEVLQKFKFPKNIAEEYSYLYSLGGQGLFDKKTGDIFEITKTKPRSFENFVKENISYFN
ncbi:MAG: NmrA family NAD(P)-binding protein, partial [Thermodesulfobacteriota bacterium]